MEKEAAERPSRALHWDGTVTAGNVLTAAAMVIALLVWGLRLESRVDIQDERQARHEAQVLLRFSEDAIREQRTFDEVKRALGRIEDHLLRSQARP
jgi:hypothetical protein